MRHHFLLPVCLVFVSACTDLEPLTFSSWEFFDASQSIRTGEDAINRRDDMIRFVFGGPMPDRLPDDVEVISDPAFPDYPIEQITVESDDLTSFAYLIHPDDWAGTLAIYHQGHRGDFRELGQRTIQGLLEAGHQVLAFSMPMIGMNTHPFPISDHGALRAREYPLRYFADPVVIGLNWAETHYLYSRRFMVGISGGGWTTVLVAGIDERIDASYPVAASWPHYLRDLYGSVGDYEQQITPNYLELYLMATHPNRDQVQVFNEFDSCCFGGLVAYDYLAYTSYRANTWGGRFQILIDHDQVEHVISNYTLQQILQLERLLPAD